MKIKTLHITAALALALAGLFTPAANAVSYTNGDLILSFYASGGTGATTDIEVDLGNYSQFLSTGALGNGAMHALSLGNFDQDLINTYGANWFDDTNLSFSISGVVKPGDGTEYQDTVFASAAETTLGTAAPAWGQMSLTEAATPTQKIETMDGQFGKGTYSDANGSQTISTSASNTTLIQEIAETDSYSSYLANGKNSAGAVDFATFTDPPGIEGSFTASGATGTVDDLYILPPSGHGSVEDLGGFQLNNSGVISFDSNVTAFTPAPEPSTYAAILCGAAVIIMAGRSRRLLRA